MSGVVFNLVRASAGYQGQTVLHDIDLTVHGGECVALMGRSGAGKSTLLALLYDQCPGAVALVPQVAALVKPLSVFHNVYMGRLDRYSTAYNLRNLFWPARRELDEISDLLTQVSLAEKIREPAGSLSGGQQQMIALARGLMTRPRAMLLDEPSLGLSPKMVASVFQVMKEINEKQGTAIMVVEHNIKSLLNIVDRCYLLDKGKVIATGSPDDLRATGILEKIFVGALE